MSFRRRTYQEIMENVLTGLTGGVSAENHAYPPNNTKNGSANVQTAGSVTHALEHPPVDSIISVFGQRNNLTFQFIQETDYQLKDDKLIWLKDGNRPDLGSNFLVNYKSVESESPFNDLHVGSVLRTLAESFSLELAGLYAQAQAVYEAGFIDSATKKSLDNVVALLGIERVKAGRNSTEIKFTRSGNSHGDIHIPAGTRIGNGDASIQFETVQSVTLQDGQNSILVDARDIDANLDPLEADSLTILIKPLAGIESVTNPKPTSVLEQDETDIQLRTRAKNFLHGSEKATLSAMEHAIAQQNIVAELSENDPDTGIVTVFIHDDNVSPDDEAKLLAAIKDVKPAGVEVIPETAPPPLLLDLEIRISTVEDLLEADLRAIQEQAVEGVSSYINSSGLGATISVNRIIGLILNDDRVLDVRIIGALIAENDVLDRQEGIIDLAMLPEGLVGDVDSKLAISCGNIEIIDPALATELSLTVNYPIGGEAPSQSAITAALSTAITAINNINDSELSDPSPEQLRKREINYGKLLAITPLPGKETITDYEDVAPLEEPGLPTSADAGDFQLQFLITSESGISRILESEVSPTITLIPYERLTLGDILLNGIAGGES